MTAACAMQGASRRPKMAAQVVNQRISLLPSDCRSPEDYPPPPVAPQSAFGRQLCSTNPYNLEAPTFCQAFVGPDQEFSAQTRASGPIVVRSLRLKEFCAS